MIQKYLNDILKTARTGDATEQSYYPDLKNFLKEFLSQKGFDPAITVQAKRQIAGIPDFTVRKGRELIGYIEAKDPKYDNLENIPSRDKEQIKRYLEKLPNIILTNFFDFWLYREGKLIKKVRIGFPKVITELKTVSPVQNEEQFIELLDLFFAYYIPETRTPKALAKELAHRAHLLTQTIVEELKNENITEIDRIYNAFKEYLMKDLTPEGFADIYAQTLAYGLFTARLNYSGVDFDRKKAGEYIPKSIKILRDTFNLISSDAIPESLESYVDDIATILAHSNIEEVKSRLKGQSGDSDPLIHFYETFLAEYNPTKRKSLGVYYTPLPVVSYIVRSVNELIKEKFGIKDGLANSAVTLLDPAAGTLTFLAESIRKAVEEQQKYSDSIFSLKEHFLNHFFAFEIQMAAYIIGHLRMSLLFEELGIPLREQERFSLYLTNSLDFSEVNQTNLPGIIADLAKEAEYAKEIKERNILAIIGNPPYLGESENKGKWILKQIEEYKKINGQPLKEKNIKWLQDDYVKFFRFAQWKIQQSGVGIVGFITNHAWLDNPTFRGMRASFLKTFDEIYVLNLHGSLRIKEKTPEGQPDENIFDIKTGVAITICVRDNNRTKGAGKVFYSDVWGSREDKYTWLRTHDIDNTQWNKLSPLDPYYLFIPIKEKGWNLYQNFTKISDIFELNNVGIVTARDSLTIAWTEEQIWATVLSFSSCDPEEARFIYKLGKDARDWKVKLAQEDIKDSGPNKELVKPILYRPFDKRYTYYTGRTRGFHCMPRPEIMRQMLHPNLALVLCRQHKGDKFYHVLIADCLVEACYVSNKTREIGYVFPLWLIGKDIDISPQAQQSIFPDSQLSLKQKVKTSNIKEQFLILFSKNINRPVTPEELFYYIYAVLYSNIYREKYEEFLKRDFPRIPLTKDAELFFKLSKLGERLVSLHLLRSDDLDDSSVRLVGKGDNKIEKREWEKDRVWINSSQYFAPVSKQVWNYFIGGYQVADKWLKDRQKRPNPYLTNEEIKTYCQIITAIMHTIVIQKEIDNLYPKVEASVI